MSISFSYPLLAILIGILVAAGFTYWTYSHSHPKPRGSKKWLLILLRAATLTLIIALLAEPLLRSLFQEEINPLVTVLVDASSSMDVVTDSSFDIGSTFRDIETQLKASNDDIDVQFVTFGSSIDEIDASSISNPDSNFSNRSQRTDISQALEEVRLRNQERNLQAVVLVSDGHYNSGSNPIYVSEKYPVPVHTLVLGDTLDRKDVKISSISTNNIAYLGRELPVRVSLLSDGYQSQTASITLRNDAGIQDDAQIRLPADQSELSIDLSFLPQSEGSQNLRVSITRFEGEASYRNNSMSTGVQVLSRKRKVLLVGGSPDPDLAAIRSMLSEIDDIELSTITQKDATSFYEKEAGLIDPKDFDAIILCGFPSFLASNAMTAKINGALAEKTPALFITTRSSNLESLDRTYGEYLPARLKNPRTGFVEIGLQPSSSGLNHATFKIDDLPENIWNMLPPLWASESLWEATPDAQTLATRNIRGIALDDPIVVARSRNQVRSIALLAAGTWRWKTMPEDLDPIKHFWPDLLSNSIQWITTSEDDRPVRVKPVRQRFTNDEFVQFSGQVYDESLNPVSDASLELVLSGPDDEVYNHGMQVVGNGRYFVDIGRLQMGTYSFQANGKRNGAEIGKDQGRFSVGETAVEYRETSANAQIMRQIAFRSGGQSLNGSNQNSLGSRISASNPLRNLVKEQDKEIELWRNYGFLAALIGLLSLEWFFRKRQGLH